jgi:hypothetical protein
MAEAARAHAKVCAQSRRAAHDNEMHLYRHLQWLRELASAARQFERVGGKYVTPGVRESFGNVAHDASAVEDKWRTAVEDQTAAIESERVADAALAEIVNAPAAVYRYLPPEILERIFRFSGNGNCRHVCCAWRAAAHGSVPFMRQLFRVVREPTEWHPNILSRPFVTIEQGGLLTVGTSRGCLQRWNPHSRDRDTTLSVSATHQRAITVMCATPEGLITVNSLGTFRSGTPIGWEHTGVTAVVAAVVKGKTVYFVVHSKGYSMHRSDLSHMLDGAEKPTCVAADGHLLAYALAHGVGYRVHVADLRSGLVSTKSVFFETEVTALGWHLGLVIVGLVGPKLVAIVNNMQHCLHSGMVSPVKSNEAKYVREGVYDILSVKAKGTRHLYASVASRFVIFE